MTSNIPVLTVMGTSVVLAIFIIVEKTAPRNKKLKRLERQILDSKK
jgi:hypothetical protein